MIKKIFYLFLASALVLSCKKEEQTPTTPTEDKLFISGEIGSTTWKAVNTHDFLHGVGHSILMDYAGDEKITVDYSATFDLDATVSLIPFPLQGKLAVNMSNFKYSYQDYVMSDEPFNNTFTAGPQSFASGISTTGAEIDYYDASGYRRSTRYGDQSGSTFKFTSISDTTIGQKKGKLCKGTFSCKIYNEYNQSLFKTITNGSFYVIFEKYY